MLVTISFCWQICIYVLYHSGRRCIKANACHQTNSEKSVTNIIVGYSNQMTSLISKKESENNCTANINSMRWIHYCHDKYFHWSLCCLAYKINNDNFSPLKTLKNCKKMGSIFILGFRSLVIFRHSLLSHISIILILV